MPDRRKPRRSPSRAPARSRGRATPLRRQLAEALERERALADILGVINSSPSAPEPVFEAILDHALRLCASPVGMLFLYDGEVFRIVAERGAAPAFVEPRRHGIRVGPHTGLGRAVAERRPVQIPDVLADRAYLEADPARLQTVELLQARTVVWVPLLREGVPVGVICVWRQEVRAFTPEQIGLLAAFASQAVIALENARLFQALDARNRELTEALEQQTATAEILRVISSSQTDVEPVFDAIARSAVSLCNAAFGVVNRYDGELVRPAAHYQVTPEGLAAFERIYPAPPSREAFMAWAILDRAIVHISDIAQDSRVPEKARALSRAMGAASFLGVPMMRDGTPIGVIGLAKQEATPFTDKQIALLETFAAQAVIAIENARLFHALDARNRELTEALEQQTATSEVLKVISRSTFDLEPVLATLIENAARLCGASMGFIFRVDGESLVLDTAHNVSSEFEELFRRSRIQPGRGTLIGRTALERRVIHIPDVLADPEYQWHEAQQVGRYRTLLAVPMLREGVLLGVIAIHREAVQPFTDRQIELVTTFADQAVIAIENVRLLRELQARNRELTESLDQQTATGEILRVISSSPTDAQPVFDTIAHNAVRLCEAAFAYVFRFDGTLMHVVAHHNLTSEALAALERQWPMRPEPRSVPARAILDRRVVHVADVLSEPDHPYLATSRALGIRSMLTVPMLRDGEPIGAIAVYRQEVSPFSEPQVALVATFASQAVIAIENVRLFQELQARNRELTESLEQQTATAEILGVISSSPTEIEPVLQAVAENAARLCNAFDSQIFRVEGEVYRRMAKHGPIPPGELADAFPMARDSVVGCAILDRRTIHVEDLLAVPGEEFRRSRLYGERVGHRSILATPLLREGAALGAIAIRRMEPGPFAEAQVRLLETFAAQAVIAIENVRLFQELQARNRELTESLEQQTATSEVLKVISRSTFDLEPVLQTLIENATRLCAAHQGTMYRWDGELFRMMATYNAPPEIRAYLERSPQAPGRDTALGRVALERQAVQIADVTADPEYNPEYRHAFVTMAGLRALVAVPMFREGALIGAIVIWSDRVRVFTPKQIELVTTFADQAVIAIENVRLLQELQARNRELTESLEQQTATSEILGVISSSPTDLQPVFDAIVRNASRLCDGHWAIAVRFDGELLHLAAQHGVRGGLTDVVPQLYPRRPGRELTTGRAILNRAPVHIPDVEADPDYDREAARASGARSFVAVPMMRDRVPIGAFAVSRATPGPFSPRHIELLKTFADQAVIAIENVRLFQELQARNRELTEALEQQTATGEILAVISSSPMDLQPVFDVIVESAVRLCEGLFAVVFRFDGELVHFAADHGFTAEARDAVRRVYPLVPMPDNPSSRAILDRSVVNIPDILSEPGYRPVSQQVLGYRSVLAVPMLRESIPIGVIVVTRTEVKPFSDREVGLLQTFASQAVIAVENVRLFQELQTRNQELTGALARQTATSEILQVISRSPTSAQPVFEAIVKSASRLLGGAWAALTRLEGDALHLGAYQLHGMPDDLVRDYRQTWPRSLDDETPAVVAVRTGQMLSMADAQTDPRGTAAGRATAVAGGYRCFAVMPMMKEGRGVGAIHVARPTVGPFTDVELALLRTFADQAVIAIENVRLFQELQARNRELTEALEQQTATAEVLKVISRSTFDLEPVLETLVENATRLCDGRRGIMYRWDGEVFRVTAAYNTPAELRAFLEESPTPAGRDSAMGRVALDRQVVHIADVTADPEYRHPARQIAGLRAVLAVPLLREGALIGAMGVWSDQVRVFTPKQIELVTTFADQAVIAIENVRLLRELRARTDELARSVQELRALGEVGQAVNSTLDVDTVLTTIVARAVELSATEGGAIYEFDEAGQEFVLRATHGMGTELIQAVRETRIRAGETPVGRAAAARRPVQVPEILEEPPYPLREVALKAGFRAFLVVPLVREEQVVGALVVRRRAPGEFPDATVNLLQTFAAQSVLAIQNARLFRELEEKSRQLEVASRHKSQFLANMSHELRTPLNAILGYTELILDSIYGEIPGRAREVMERIDKSGRHLLGLINDVLDLSKIEAGQLTLSLTDYSLRDVVQTVATAVEALAAEKQLALKVVIAPDLPRGRGDERRLAQVLLNLVGNAIKFTEAGEVRVEATAADGRFLVAVTDTGLGIAPADQERIFEEFQQADTSSTRKKGGTGLGLSIARRIVELHGGRLWVESAPGKGSTFRFTVPVRA